jgi:hypothetical protein
MRLSECFALLAIVENYFRFACYPRSISTTDRILIWNVTGMITKDGIFGLEITPETPQHDLWPSRGMSVPVYL